MDLLSDPIKPLRDHFIKVEQWSENTFEWALRNGVIRFAIHVDRSIDESIKSFQEYQRQLRVKSEMDQSNETHEATTGSVFKVPPTVQKVPATSEPSLTMSGLKAILPVQRRVSSSAVSAPVLQSPPDPTPAKTSPVTATFPATLLPIGGPKTIVTQGVPLPGSTPPTKFTPPSKSTPPAKFTLPTKFTPSTGLSKSTTSVLPPVGVSPPVKVAAASVFPSKPLNTPPIFPSSSSGPPKVSPKPPMVKTPTGPVVVRSPSTMVIFPPHLAYEVALHHKP